VLLLLAAVAVGTMHTRVEHKHVGVLVLDDMRMLDKETRMPAAVAAPKRSS